MRKAEKPRFELRNNESADTSLNLIQGKVLSYYKRIRYVSKRWYGQWRFFSPKIAICDFLVTTVLRKSNGRLKHFLNFCLYNKAKDVVAQREAHVIEKWKRNPKTNEKIAQNGMIFLFWWQGLNDAPILIKECVSVIRQNAGKHDVIIIDKDNWRQYTYIPDYILKKMEAGTINFTLFSDILRCCLLYEYGGIWIDPTCYLTKEFDDEIYDKYFYSIKHGDAWEHPICKGFWATFFIAAGKHNSLIGFMKDMFFEYWKTESVFVVYLSLDLFLSIAYDTLPYAKEMIDNVPMNNEHRDDLRKLLIKNKGIGFDELMNQVDSETYIHKLTYKMFIERFS